MDLAIDIDIDVIKEIYKNWNKIKFAVLLNDAEGNHIKTC